MEQILKFFDVYGREFSLLINGQTKFRSIIGGLLSIITVAVLTWCIISFGSDFYNKQNPKVNIGDGIFSNNDIPILNGSSYQEKYIILQYDRNYDKLFRPTVYYREFNTSDYSYEFISQCPLEYLTLKNIVKDGEDYNYHSFTYYCLRMNNYYLGGKPYTYDAISSYYPLTISQQDCKEITHEEIQKYNITSCDQSFNTTLDSMVVAIWYDKIGFVPDSKFPFINKIMRRNFFMKQNLTYMVEIPININELKDDVGFLSEIFNTSFDLNIEGLLFYEMYFYSDKKYPGFDMHIYLSDSYKTYTRKYQKLQDLLALIGGFMKVQFTIFSLFESFIRIYLIDSYIADEIFVNFENFENFELSQKMNKNHYLDKSSLQLDKNQLRMQNLNSSLIIEKIEKDEKLRSKKKFSIYLKFLGCSNTELKDCSNSVDNLLKNDIKPKVKDIKPIITHINSTTKVNFKKPSNHLNKINLKKIFSNEIVNDNNYNNNAKTKRMTNIRETKLDDQNISGNLRTKNFNLCSYLKVIFSLTLNRNFNIKSEKGSKLQIIKNKIIVSDLMRDYNYILKKVIEIDILKKFILNDSQALCLNYLQKPNDVFSDHNLYNFSTLINSDEKNISEIKNYFTKVLEEGDLEGNDKILYDGLNFNIRANLMKKKEH